MPRPQRTWQEELAIIDRTMKAISGITDPEKLVDVYWEGVGEFIPTDDYLTLSRRNVPAPEYLITRSSRFTEHPNPWTQRERLPRLSGGLLGDIIYANKPCLIEDLPVRLRPDDPAHFYLDGFKFLVACPHYDNGEALNVSIVLGADLTDLQHHRIPMMNWQTSLFGRGTQNLVLRNELTQAVRSLEREMQVVGDIQRSLLPVDMPRIPGLQIAADYRTSARAGGDYYDFFPLANGSWGFFLADVSGHGTPAAVLMAIVRALIHSNPQLHGSPGALLTRLNAELSRSYTKSGSFVTAYAAAINPIERTVVHSSAGHCPARLHRDGDVLSLRQPSALPLGIIDGQTYDEALFTLEKNDTVLLYTDGISEAMAPKSPDGRRELFGTGRMDAILKRHASNGAEACIQAMNAAMDAYCAGEAPTDDRTMLVLRVT
jgi:sigma-B regulation protein RsbU (phosphoserine phosphatase)